MINTTNLSAKAGQLRRELFSLEFTLEVAGLSFENAQGPVVPDLGIGLASAKKHKAAFQRF